MTTETEQNEPELEWVYSETPIEGDYFSISLDKYLKAGKREDGSYELMALILELGLIHDAYLKAAQPLRLFFGDDFKRENVKFFNWKEVAGPLSACYGVLAKYNGKKFWECTIMVS